MQPAPAALALRIDHVLLRPVSPRNVFSLLSDVLGLPIAWPYAEYGGFTSGGIFVGNCVLEVLDSDWARPEKDNGIVGIALEPRIGLSGVARELAQEGMGDGAPHEHVRGNAVAWRVVHLANLLGDRFAFYVEYVDRSMLTDSARMRQSFDSSNGGPLGLVAVKEVIVQARGDPGVARWERALGARASPDGAITFLSGPQLRLTPGAIPLVDTVVLRVRDLERALDMARTFNLPVESRARGAAVAPAPGEQLSLTLVPA